MAETTFLSVKYRVTYTAKAASAAEAQALHDKLAELGQKCIGCPHHPPNNEAGHGCCDTEPSDDGHACCEGECLRHIIGISEG